MDPSSRSLHAIDTNSPQTLTERAWTVMKPPGPAKGFWRGKRLVLSWWCCLIGFREYDSRAEEALEASQCAVSLDAGQAWGHLCKSSDFQYKVEARCTDTMVDSTDEEMHCDAAFCILACLHTAISHPATVAKFLANCDCALVQLMRWDAIIVLFVCRLPSHRLDRTSRGNACH